MGRTLQFNVSDPSLDCNVTAHGTFFGVTNQSTTEIAGNELTAMGTISASLGANTPPDGTVSADVDATYLPLMQLNFTVGEPEDVSVTSLTVTWNGTKVGATVISGIGIVNDTNGDGVIDWDLGETVISATTFIGNTSVLDLSRMADVTKGNTSSILIYVNTSARDIESGDKLAINISNPSTDYSAVGVESGLPINDTSTTAISSNVQTARHSGEIWVDQLPLVTDTIIKNEPNVDVVLLRLNLTAKGERVNVTSMKIKGIGRINETGNVTEVALRTDEEVISDRKDFELDDGYVELTISPELTIGKDASKEIDVIATISTVKLSAGDEIIVGLNNPATDLEAVGHLSRVLIQNTTTTALKNTTTVTGNISVDLGLNNTETGPITARGPVVDHNNTAILQLNFSASYEAINITAINVTWLGSENATNNITVVAYNDTNGTIPNDGKWDANDTKLGEAIFVYGTANVPFVTNLTVPGGNFRNMLLCLNVTRGYNFTIGKELKINVTNYIAVGSTSNKTITPIYGMPKVSNTLTGTGNITVVNGTATPQDQHILAGANTTVPVWQLNMSTNEENATLDSITLTFNGTANVTTDIAKVDLYHDLNASGMWDAGEPLIASNDTFVNRKVILVPTETFSINTTPVKSLLVTVNTTNEFKDNETIAFNITVNTTAPKMETPDVKATGVVSGIVIATNYTVPLSSNTLTGYGSIDVYDTTQPTVAYGGEHTYVEVLKLNFNATRGPIDIMNITLREEGTAKVSAPNRGVKNISVWMDGTAYNTTAVFTVENGTLIINTTTPQLVVDGLKTITIKVNTTKNLTVRETLFFEVNRSLGTGYNATCNESRKTPYSIETGEINNTITVGVPPIPVEQIGLDVDWNLISLWLIPDNTSIDAVTADIQDNLYGVYYYDAYTRTWKAYFPDWGVAGSNLKTMTAGLGYWIKMDAVDTLPVRGYFAPPGPVTPPSYSIYEGWNLIGFHSEREDITARTYFGTQGTHWRSIFKWNNQTDSYTSVKPTTILNQGEGYWLAALKNYTVYPM